jgi:hypothetical protein
MTIQPLQVAAKRECHLTSLEPLTEIDPGSGLDFYAEVALVANVGFNNKIAVNGELFQLRIRDEWRQCPHVDLAKLYTADQSRLWYASNLLCDLGRYVVLNLWRLVKGKEDPSDKCVDPARVQILFIRM